LLFFSFAKLYLCVFSLLADKSVWFGPYSKKHGVGRIKNVVSVLVLVLNISVLLSVCSSCCQLQTYWLKVSEFV